MTRFAKSQRTTRAFILALAALAVALLPHAAGAQQRTDPSPGKTETPPPASNTRPPGSETDTPGGGGIGGLPDAVTVLEILRRLPHFPGRGSEGPDYGPDDGRQPPRNEPKGDEPGFAAMPPRRVVVVPPAGNFTPRPAPRPAGAAPIAVGPVLPETREREVVVTLSTGSDANTVYELSQDHGLDGDTLYQSALLGSRVVRFRIPDARSVADVLQQLALDVRVTAAQPSYVFVASGAAQQPVSLPVPQYAPEKLNLKAAHKITQGKRVKIAVIDTAVDAKHPALAGAIAGTFDAIGESKPVADAHGTAIAGIVGARAELTGVAPEASVLGIRAFETEAGGPPQSNTVALLKALDWAVLSGARVINMSFAGPEDALLGKAIAAAIKRGVVAVAAAGNNGPEAKPAYPGAFPGVIAVTATDSKDAIFKDANHGDYIAVAAPGVDIVAAAPNGAYDISSGTSMAAAHVSGIAALLLERKPGLTPDDVRGLIEKSARKAAGTTTETFGSGIADAAAAVARVK